MYFNCYLGQMFVSERTYPICFIGCVKALLWVVLVGQTVSYVVKMLELYFSEFLGLCPFHFFFTIK